jgi:hypothetical protein
MTIIQFNDKFIEIVLQYKIIGYMKENGFSGFFLHFNRSFICVNNIK